MIRKIIQILIITLSTSVILADKRSNSPTIDFSKEKPLHPYYENLDENSSIDYKEKQLCMENCGDSFTFIYNKNMDKNKIRLSCLADCSKIICVKKKKK